MKLSFDQQAAHRPASPTGSRQEAQSCGSATSTASPKAARSAPATRPKRPARACVVVAPASMQERYRSGASASTSLSLRPSKQAPERLKRPIEDSDEVQSAQPQAQLSVGPMYGPHAPPPPFRGRERAEFAARLCVNLTGT